MPSTFRKRSLLTAPILMITLTFLLALPLSAQHQHPMAPKPETSRQASQVKQMNVGPKLAPNAGGSWSAPVDMGVIAIHAALLHTGKVLAWWYPLGQNVNAPAGLLDLKTGATKDVTIPFAGDFFCSGQTIMADGRVLVTGGLNGNPYPGVPDYGIPLTAIFDPATETWTQGTSMNLARWYPANVEMANGKILTLTGKDEGGIRIQTQMEVYDPSTATWTILPSSANIPSTSDTYLKMKVLPNGRIFMAGANAQTRLFNPLTNRWAPGGVLNFGNRYHGAVVLLPGTAAQPLIKVLTAAGTTAYPGGGATATAEVIDFSAPTPAWTYINPMNIPRYNANLVLLADGTVLIVGGAQAKKYTDPVHIPELYDPNTGVWTEMATQTAARTYHSTALLLPDGTVLSAGSDDPDNHATDFAYEIFSPPYLFKGARPVISSAPTSLTYNQQFTITTADAASIKSVAVVRPAATTHDNDMDQRYVPLKFQRGNGLLKAIAPLNSNYAPPGWYMLVIVNTNGVPSVMPFLQLQ
jgi:hypothetical protein